jgi:hypothetical protein
MYCPGHVFCIPVQKLSQSTAASPPESGVGGFSSNPEIVRQWWEATPNANIGIAIGIGALEGVRVLDSDVRSGGPATLAELQAKHGELPTTVVVETATGGTHHFFRVPTGNYRTKIAQGVDLLGPGRYVVAPPSLNREGKAYRRMSEKGIAIAPAPAWLIEMARVPDPPAPSDEQTHYTVGADVIERARKYLDATPPAISGSGGHGHTFLVAQKIVRGFGLSVSEAFDLLLVWNRNCQPPWSAAELMRKVMEASKAGRMTPGSLLERRSA